jgi:hypothetical protein
VPADLGRQQGEMPRRLRHPGQVTPDIDSLLSADADDGDGDWRSTAIIGGPWENDSSLAFGS